MTKFILGIAVLCLGFIGQAQAQTPFFGTGSSNVALWCLNSGGTAWIPAGGAAASCIGSGGGGGGGPVTAVSGAFVDGSVVTIGTEADAAWTSGSGTLVALLKGIYGRVGIATPAGTNVIGHVIADTGSTTAVTALPAIPTGANVIGALTANQSVNTAQVNGVTTLTGTGAVGTGAQRVAVGTDSATIAGSAPSTVLLANPTTPYPSTAVPITASATGTTGATTATLTAVSGHTTYICGLSIRANATAAATGNATVTGTITGTLNFTQWTAPNASGLGINEQVFAPCVPASAVTTNIAVISAAPGTGGVVSVTAWGYSI